MHCGHNGIPPPPSPCVNALEEWAVSVRQNELITLNRERGCEFKLCKSKAG